MEARFLRNSSNGDASSNARSAVTQVSIVQGPGSGQRFNVESALVIGRSLESAIVIDHEEVSRAHARIFRGAQGGFYIEDLGSRNGTFVGESRVSERRALNFGDRIRIGSEVELEFSVSLGITDQLAQRHRFEMLGRLGSGAAHDMHNLITAVGASASALEQLLRGRGESDPDVLECIFDLVQASSRAGEFATAMMDFARGGRPERSVVDLSALVGEALKMLEPTLAPGILVLDRRAQDVFVMGSRSDLLQVFLNLGWNALEAMPDGGTLSIETSLLERAPAGVELSSGRRVAQLSVVDSGVGMDETTLARSFDPFFTTKDQGQGYGLGLATVQEIVTLYGGQLRVESAPNQGTRFDLYFPALNASALRLVDTVERQDRRQDAFARRVLLVDKDGVIRRTLGRLLRGSSFDVIECSSAGDALKRLEREPIDLVVLDSKTPGVDSPELHQRFLAIQPEIRTIYAAGGTTPDAALGPAPQLLVLRKPFSFQQLLSAAERLLHSPPARTTRV